MWILYFKFFYNIEIKNYKGWRELSFDCMRTDVGPFISLIFLISWIIIGNYILLNLFLAILLDGFNSTQEINEEIEGMPKRIEYENVKNPNIDKESENQKTECKNSLFFLPKENPTRKFFRYIVKHKSFDSLILIFIFMSSLNLVYDTYIDSTSTNQLEQKQKKISDLLNLVFNIIFLTESLMKIISYGFIICPDSYLRDYWNIIDFTIVIISFIDMFTQNLNLPNVKVKINTVK